MNIIQTFRRKNKYHKPLIVFKELYRDYFKHTSPLKYSCLSQAKIRPSQTFATWRNENVISNDQCQGISRLQKTRSAEHLSQYLQKYGETGSSFLKQTSQEQKVLKRSLSIKKTKVLSQLTNLNQREQLENNKRGYFEDSYTKNHPFFSKNKNLFAQKLSYEKQNQVPAILPDIFKQSGRSLKTPLERRVQMQELKSKFIERKQISLSKFSKVRYNFILQKNYTSNTEKRIFKTQRPSNINSFQVTKQNIFPQSIQ